MPDVFNVLMVGVGGQGVVLTSDILAEAALRAGLDAKKSEIHGMSQRGGPVFSHVRFGDVVHSPVIAQGEADLLFGLERMELLRWLPWAKPDASACYVEKDMLPTGVEAYPERIDDEVRRRFARVVSFSSKALRSARISPKVIGTVLLGAASVLMPIPADVFPGVLTDLAPAGTGEANVTGFALGREVAAQQLGVAADA